MKNSEWGIELKYRVYLDNCCFNRPYDDQSYLATHLETEAKLFIQQEILKGGFELAWSYILDFENSVNPYDERKNSISKWRDVAVVDIDVSKEVVDRGNLIMQRGVNKKDALHLACAIEAECDYFLTTDKKLLNKAIPGIISINPLDFIRKLEV